MWFLSPQPLYLRSDAGKNKGNASAYADVIETKGKEMSNIDYSNPDATPPMGQAIPLGVQHVLAMFASNVTPAVIVAGAAGLAFGGAEQVYLIQMAMLFAGIATLFQTVGLGPIGARLPIMQGTSLSLIHI